ncbi:hypothetical protein CRENPOLYSF1_1330008 [Crenothrix polyspora]|uniref:Uncharacterized protein n=1 Tax=Crenothrix polyspora TaxID=360316 RepID=A0A1R4H2J5_9GAMM|nr:hypothetical protein CRENPOLYSF1_1330008 [Crenothrix polyspora]
MVIGLIKLCHITQSNWKSVAFALCLFEGAGKNWVTQHELSVVHKKYKWRVTHKEEGMKNEIK